MSKRYVYTRATVQSWSIIDTIKAPAPCEVIAFVPEMRGPMELLDCRQAELICEVMNRDHEMQVQVESVARKEP